MRKLMIPIILLCAAPAVLHADIKVKGHIKPLPSELLAPQVKLNNHCDKVTIVEWRGTSNTLPLTTPSKKAIKVIDDICNLALSKFPEFARKKNLKPDMSVTFKAKVALMPASIYNEGLNYRNLNDIKYRFANRDRQEVKYIWGLGAESGYLYVRNDVLSNKNTANRRFEIIFAHELFHMISFQYNIFDKHSDIEEEKYKINEKLALEFTEHLKLGK